MFVSQCCFGRGANHARKFADALRVSDVDKELYYAEVPLWDKDSDELVPQHIPIQLPHESIARELAREPSLYSVRGKDPKEWDIPLFTQHPVVQRHGKEAVSPISLYSDAVVYGSDNDSLYIAYWQSMFDKRRHVIFAVMKSTLCQCGCRGRCSLEPLWRVVTYSLKVGMQG